MKVKKKALDRINKLINENPDFCEELDCFPDENFLWVDEDGNRFFPYKNLFDEVVEDALRGAFTVIQGCEEEVPEEVLNKLDSLLNEHRIKKEDILTKNASEAFMGDLYHAIGKEYTECVGGKGACGGGGGKGGGGGGSGGAGGGGSKGKSTATGKSTGISATVDKVTTNIGMTDPEERRIFKQIIDRSDFVDFVDFLALRKGFNSERMWDNVGGSSLDRSKATNDARIAKILKSLSSPGGVKKYKSFKGYGG